MSDIIWMARLDDRYDVEVRRVEPYRGLLWVVENYEVVHQEEVTLSGDAEFGPDESDVLRWQLRALAAVKSLPDKRPSPQS